MHSLESTAIILKEKTSVMPYKPPLYNYFHLFMLLRVSQSVDSMVETHFLPSLEIISHTFLQLSLEELICWVLNAAKVCSSNMFQMDRNAISIKTSQEHKNVTV